MPKRIHGGQVLVVVGGAALIVSLFLNWFEPGNSAWTVFETMDLVLAAIGLAAVAAVLPAPAASGESPEVGAWIGLAAAIVLTTGASLSSARISVVITLRRTERSEPVEVDPEGETQTHPLPGRDPAEGD